MNFESDKNSAIEALLHPLEVDNFFDQYWEQSPVHIERTDQQHFSDILSISSIDTLISSRDLFFPDVQLIKQPDGLSKESYTESDNKILPLRLIEHYTTGATLTIAGADAKIATLREFCRRLQSEWQMQTRANVYLSPPGHQGFNPHYDTHDVFIVQASGKKQFNFYSNNVDLPFNEDEFSAPDFSPGQKTEEITLSAGDTLYIPRGITHDAIALDQSPSLHITLGVYPVTTRDLLQEIAQIAAEQDSRLRYSVPLGHALLSSGLQDTTTELRELVNEILTKENVGKALGRYKDQATMQCAQDASGLLSRQYLSNPVTEQTTVTIRRHMVISVENVATIDEKNTITTLRTPGQIVEFHQPLGDAVQWLINQQSVVVGDIPLLSREQKLALIDKLSQQNIVSIDTTTEP